MPSGKDFVEVRVPFKAFSDKWSPASGEQTVRCAEDQEVCPKERDLSKIQRLELWAEGALGHVHLEALCIGRSFVAGEVKSIRAFSEMSQVPKQYNSCSQPVQKALRYNISSRKEQSEQAISTYFRMI